MIVLASCQRNSCIDNLICHASNRAWKVKENSMDNDIPLAGLISIAYRTQEIYLNSKMRRLGLSSGRFIVLIYLSREQNVTQEDLAEHFHIDKSTIARSVGKLESAGYVRREIDPSDRRAVRLFLTKRGEDVVPEIRKIGMQWEEIACAGLSEDERSNLYSLLYCLAANSLENIEDCAD